MRAGLPGALAGSPADHPGPAGGGGIGITTLKREFLTNVVLPDGGTVGQWLAP